ncbi:Rieske (2Fe-2S) protein [Streptomyces sp. NPDC059096]|uniref:Rieske (2Fe-2S) protein n=1 Tax=unclassified Streptomyces TaxID=2593676 RepID=UPI003690B5D1
MAGSPAPRRTVLKGAALAGVAGLGAAACSTDSKLGHAETPTPTAPVELGAASDVPVGGAKLYKEERVVVSCPEKGRYKAFSAQCTHAGCLLGSLEGTVGDCPCHGSKFDVTTGQVLHGPATVPLPEVPVTETDGKLVAGPKG